MFDIGFTELIVIAIIALIVIGPEQLPTTIRTVTLWLSRIRRSFQQAKAEIQREIGAEEIRAQLHNEAIMQSLKESKQDLENSVADIHKSIAAQAEPAESNKNPASVSNVKKEDSNRQHRE